MTEKAKIKANLANMLTYIGQLYRNPRDALKEYVSNDIDRYVELRNQGQALNGKCRVQLLLNPHTVIIRSHSQAGQDKTGLKNMMERVADSMKIGMGVPQIGRLAIGIFAFNQFASKVTFLSKPSVDQPTWKLTLVRNSDEYELEESLKRERLSEPGMDVIISGLFFDPTRLRSSLSPNLLSKYLSEWYDFYIREGTLDLRIVAKGQEYEVEPLTIDLPEVGVAFRMVLLKGNQSNVIKTKLWFDPSGTARVAIRNAGVPIVEDMRRLDEIKLGFQQTVYASGFLSGVIDTDFLKPLPARTGFEINEDFKNMLDWFEQIEPSLKSEVDEHRLELELKHLENIKDKAKKIAMEILDLEPFQQLELLGGMKRSRQAATVHGVHKGGKETGAKSIKEGDKSSKQSLTFQYVEQPLSDKWTHSQFDRVHGKLILNTLNPNYEVAISKGQKVLTKYATLLIGKETIGCNDHTRGADYYLEKLLAYTFAVESKIC